MDRRHNNYTLSILLATLLGSGIILTALLLHLISLGVFPEWIASFVDVTFALFFISRNVSGVSYIANLFDQLTNGTTVVHLFYQKFLFKPKNKLSKNPTISPSPTAGDNTKENAHEKPGKGQILGNLFGFAQGMVVAILGITLRAAIQTVFTHSLGEAIYFIATTSNFSGLFNRLGRCVDYAGNNTFSTILRGPEVNYVGGVLGGAIAGVVLGCVILAVVGVTSAMSFGAAAPLWVGACIFMATTISTGASAGGYIGRCCDFFLGERTVAGLVQDKIKGRSSTSSISKRANCERVGTLIGIGIGVTLGIVLILAGVATLPFFGLGLPKLFAGIVLVTACVSQGGGLGNRIGRAIDTFLKKQDTAKGEVESIGVEKNQHENDNTNDRSHDVSKSKISVESSQSTDENMVKSSGEGLIKSKKTDDLQEQHHIDKKDEEVVGKAVPNLKSDCPALPNTSFCKKPTNDSKTKVPNSYLALHRKTINKNPMMDNYLQENKTSNISTNLHNVGLFGKANNRMVNTKINPRKTKQYNYGINSNANYLRKMGFHKSAQIIAESTTSASSDNFNIARGCAAAA